METLAKTRVTVETTVNDPVEKVWDFWTDPNHVVHWNNASDDWHTPHAENDFRIGGKFRYRMESKDGSSGFNFTGEYNNIELYKHIEYTLTDGRRVWIIFSPKGTGTRVAETFEAEQTNSVDMQQSGWQSILNNFRKYVESKSRETMHFERIINCKVERVYKVMLDEEKFKDWTAVFMPTSHFKGSWVKGSKILFLGKNKEGNLEGMVSKIRENIPNKFVSIEHRGFINNDEEITTGPEAEKWKGLENYTFTAMNDKTLLSVDMDTSPEMWNYFMETWPKALDRLASICETEQ